ncbi:MAG: AEC family transporter [Proteobacteria bacterium]|nr:AEC family transporter [Pseudomonadota bacterium]
MTVAIFYKLAAIFLTVALGWVAGRMRWLDVAPQPGGGSEQADPARLLGNAAFYIFVPALLFRTTVRLDFATMPWRTVAAYFVPALVFLFGVYLWQRRRAGAARHGAAAPSVRAIAATFGNSVQVGIPMAAALFGEAGLAIHIALVSLHAIVLLSVLTTLAELDIERRRAATGQATRLWPMLRQTLRNTIIHPVVLPVLAGMLWHATGLGLHPVVDETLALLGSAVVPICLVLIGLTLAYYDLQGQLRAAFVLSALKLLALPALVLATAHWGFGLSGLPLSVVVLMAALPAGSNALIFSQRYATLQAETTATIVISTVGFIATASLWLALLTALGA